MKCGRKRSFAQSSLAKHLLEQAYEHIAFPHTSFGVRSSRIHLSLNVREGNQCVTNDVCGEANEHIDMVEISEEEVTAACTLQERGFEGASSRKGRVLWHRSQKSRPLVKQVWLPLHSGHRLYKIIFLLCLQQSHLSLKRIS